MEGKRLLEIKDLHTVFHTDDGAVRAVDGVDLWVDEGEVLGLVGESGCGKSVTAHSVMRLVSPPGRIESGEILFRGRNLLKVSQREMHQVRGSRIAMIYQEPMSSLNPLLRVGTQIVETVTMHMHKTKREALGLAVDMLRAVGIPDPEHRVHDYPHQLSGGMRQRVMIAMGMVCNPRLMIADEPTTALDVSIQAQILDLLRNLVRETNAAVMLITHDMGVVAETADRVAVMYTGKVVEQADVKTLVHPPGTPLYARAAGFHPGRVPPGAGRSDSARHSGHGAEPAQTARRVQLPKPLRQVHGQMRARGPAPVQPPFRS